MTLSFEERRALKRLISDARRSQVKPVCEHCGEEFDPLPGREQTQRYCGKRCRDAADYHRGRERAAA